MSHSMRKFRQDSVATRAGAALAGVLSIALVASAAEPQRAKASSTEVWDPVPAKIDAGDAGTAPSDAVVLFDGSDLSAWQGRDGDAAWTVEDGAFTVAPGAGDIRTRQDFGSVQLHIEWRSPTDIVGEGQGRGNSGVFLMGRYGVQVLGSHESVTYSNGQAGSIYKQSIPAVNAARAPGEWQSYDIVFMAPRFDAAGNVERPTTITVFHNGVLIQNHFELRGPTVFIGEPAYEAHPAKLPLSLQDHTNLVSYRNIWVRELD